ncbi:MAG: type VI secretion system accessory protein TagJ [Planctomycetota bacterium]|nr:type VI secretion system accessory protein TagJ [Planctomycetota bacterium]
MKAADLIKAGKVDEGLLKLQDEVRANPADAKLRVFLFQLLSVMGQWERALTQLDVSAQMDPVNLLMAQVCRQAIMCEMFRAEVFAGQRAPLVFGEPEQWVALMIQANMLEAQGKASEARPLRDQALELAPAVPGTITLGTNETGQGGDAKGQGKQVAFGWIADADERMGPIAEGIIEGKYYWIPWQRIKALVLEAPADLRDAVWLPATFIWTTGASSVGLMPARYPGSESSPDGLIRLGRKTEWVPGPGGTERVVGQRLFATDEGEFAMLDCRNIQLGDGQAGDPSSSEK